MLPSYLFISLAGAFSTFELSKFKNIGSIRSSCLTSLLFYGVLNTGDFFTAYQQLTYSSLFFGASFVGMCSSSKFGRKNIFLASVLFTYFFIELVPSIKFLGGALGFSAFLSVLLSQFYFFGRNWLVLKLRNEEEVGST